MNKPRLLGKHRHEVPGAFDIDPKEILRLRRFDEGGAVDHRRATLDQLFEDVLIFETARDDLEGKRPFWKLVLGALTDEGTNSKA